MNYEGRRYVGLVTRIHTDWNHEGTSRLDVAYISFDSPTAGGVALFFPLNGAPPVGSTIWIRSYRGISRFVRIKNLKY